MYITVRYIIYTEPGTILVIQWLAFKEPHMCSIISERHMCTRNVYQPGMKNSFCKLTSKCTQHYQKQQILAAVLLELAVNPWLAGCWYFWGLLPWAAEKLQLTASGPNERRWEGRWQVLVEATEWEE